MIRAMQFLGGIGPIRIVPQYQKDFRFSRAQHLTAEGMDLTVGPAEMQVLLLHEYWTRLWIIQEVLLASELLVQCGTLSAPFTHFKEIFEIIGQHQGQFNRRGRQDGGNRLLLTKVINSPLALLVSRRGDSIDTTRGRAGEYPLLYLCADHAGSQCLDERDRIFGLCSLALLCCIKAVPVDYSRSYFEICDMVLANHCIYHADESDGAIRDSRTSAILGINILGDNWSSPYTRRSAQT
ncbi:hypothetical protein BKA64DRAFT_384617 [Cadophora sp. MPI-SDFR-AT-0126]|nr:hypothetical protein BKA64DRAFT_384617 [Leotiomycetes sp. MPI-SDFR-AT-0126]